MMTPAIANAILEDISYKDWDIYISDDPEDFWLQVGFIENGQFWKSRKWRLSQHMTKSELIQTALKAILTAEEHEAREKFLYKGKAIFGPHLDVDVLLEMADRKEVRA